MSVRPSHYRRYWLWGLLLALLVSSVPAGAQQDGHTVPAARLERLARGVNIPHWFWATYTSTPEELPDWFSSYMRPEDFDNLASLDRLTFVRLPIDHAYLYDPAQPGTLRPDYLPLIDAGVQRLLDLNLAVIVTPFGDYIRQVGNPENLPQSADFLTAFAAHFSQYSPDMLFMQVANEPFSEDPQQWSALQSQLLDVMRAAAPEHTFIAGSSLKFGPGENDWGNPESLAATTPAADRNVVYSYHFYEPTIFTEQGYAGDWEAWVFNLPYPATLADVAPIALDVQRNISDESFSWVPYRVLDYGNEGWNRERIAQRLGLGIDWARANNVPLVLDEFGVFANSPAVPPAARLNWLRDVRSVMEDAGYGWAVWDYNGGYGLTIYPDTTLNAGVVAALGLTSTAP